MHKKAIAKNEITLLVFRDLNVVMLANKTSDNIPISKHHDTDSDNITSAVDYV